VGDSTAASWASGALVGRPSNKVADFTLRRIAATETARAYGNELRDSASQLASILEPAGMQTVVVERWNAVLDGRVCFTCADMNGAEVPLGAHFRDGLVPGEVHPMCRCVAELVHIDKPLLRAA